MPARLSSYYFSLKATGVPVVDAILIAVADAAHGHHHTKDWQDGGVVEPIEAAAKAAAEEFSRLRAELKVCRAGGRGRAADL